MPDEIKQENSEENKELDVNDRQERFCQLYATDKEFFGNGVETYLEVYDINKTKPNWYKTACAAASRLLSNVKVIDRINEILEESGLNDAFVDKQLKFLLTQHADFGSKMNAIKEYNKLKQRIIDKSENKIILPEPILATYVRTNDSNKENSGNDQENPGSTGGDIGQQDNIDRASIDGLSTERQDANPNEHSIGVLASLEKRGDEGLSEHNADPQILQGQSVEQVRPDVPL